MKCSLTIIIPTYNDEKGLKTFLPKLISVCSRMHWHIVIVNDCSTDNTISFISKYSEKILIINNSKNLGYGASIKRGIVATESEWIATMDADGQHLIKDLEKLASFADYSFDAILGNRKKTSHESISRMPGKWILKNFANYITGQKIPDINCGLRILRRDVMLRLLSLTSDRFSFSTSTTICLMQLECRIKFVDVTQKERIGNSQVKQVRDGLYTLLLMIRLIVLFRPLRVILPTSLLFIAFAVINQIITSINRGFDISDATVLAGLTGLVFFFMALIADQISGLRRDMLLHDIKLEQLRSDQCNSNIKE